MKFCECGFYWWVVLLFFVVVFFFLGGGGGQLWYCQLFFFFLWGIVLYITVIMEETLGTTLAVRFFSLGLCFITL